jgi:hypothetical protein
MDAPEMELIPEREDEIIEVITRRLTSAKMSKIGFLFGSPLVPGTVWISSIFLIPLAPVLELFGIKGYEIAAFMNNRKAVERLMQRLESAENW